MNPSRIAGSLHVYAGLFLAPLAALFAVSVFVINHPLAEPAGTERQWEAAVVAPPGVETLSGRERIEKLRPLLDSLGVGGEVGFIRYLAKEARMVIPVTTPAEEAVVDLRLREQAAVVKVRKPGALRGTAYLHKMPGPHLVNIRGNWAGTRIWKALADGTVYLILLTTVTGIWLWWPLRPLRKAGLAWLTTGAILFVGVICALVL